MTSRRAFLPGLSLLLAVLTCPFPSAVPGTLLDDSWGYAVHSWITGAAGDVPVTYFTYGPLGFLTAPAVWERWTYAAAVLFLLAVQVALCRLLLARLLRLWSLPVAAVVTLLLAALVDTYAAETLVVVGTLVAAELLQDGVRRPRVTLALSCLVSGAALLVKFSTGVVTLLLLVIVAFALARRRRLAVGVGALLGSLLVSAVLFACVTGHLGEFPTWLKSSQEIASGYVAMGLEGPGAVKVSDYLWAAPLLLGLLWLAAALAFRRRDLAAVAGGTVVVLTTYLSFREGFTRHDARHLEVFVSALTFLPFALLLGRRSRWLLVPLVLGAIAYGHQVSETTRFTDRYALVSNVQTLANRLHLVVDPSPAQRQGRADLRERFPLPAPVLSALRGHRVHVDPYDTGLLYGYDLRWGPTAVYAGYTSYTPWLDSRNAASLSGLDRVLRYRGTKAIDARYALFESPRYQLALQCRWRPVVTSGLWQVLEPGPDRCATSSPLGSSSFAAGQAVTVPAARQPDGIVTVSLQLDVPLMDALEGLVFKPWPQRYLMLNGARYRLVVATAGGPLVLRLPASDPGAPERPGAPDTFGPKDVRTLVLPFSGTATFTELSP